VPAKKARKARKATRSIRPTIRPKSAVPTTDAPAGRALTPRAVFAGAICVMAAAVLIAARQPFQQTDAASISAPPTAMPLPEEIAVPKPVTSPIAVAASMIASKDTAAAPAQLETKTTALPKSDRAAVARPFAAASSIDKTTSAESVKAIAVEPAAKAEAPTTHTAVESISNADSQTATSVTITGCVSNDEETFWLKDTAGADAPKSRNWKSGFLRKRPAPVALLDANHALKLPNYVGQRVAATGTLVNREMRAQSLQRVGSSCS